MAEPVVCGACGAKIKGSRTQCLRCGEKLLPAEAVEHPQGAQGAFQQRGPLLIGGTIASLIVLLLLVAMLRQPPVVPVTTPQAAAPAASSTTSSPVLAPPPTVPEARTASDSARAATAAYAQGNLTTALEQYQLAVEKSPDDPLSLNNLGQVLVRVGRARDAIPYFNRAIALTPSEWAPRFNLAHAYDALGEWSIKGPLNCSPRIM
jgi:tetratricopeptide (TPR) repeat protein